MSIFINKEAKERAKSYWFGFLTPILLGVGCSFLSFFVLVNLFPSDKFTYVPYLFGTFLILGPLVIWPLSAWGLARRANKMENLSCKNGAWTSIKLYIMWVAWIVLAGILESA